MNGVSPPFDEEDIDEAVMSSWRTDQMLGSILERWATRTVPDGHCRFCNAEIEGDPVTEGVQEFCDEDCHSEFETVFSARLALGRRDLDQRGYD